jgi:LmbE family N-acetylglucosaminyl deacetylase
MRPSRRRLLQAIAVFHFLALSVPAQVRAAVDSVPDSGHPRVLIVVAHPDDESCFSATVYHISRNLGGAVDQLMITNGEGGYRYSLLAESYYRAPLTDEAEGGALLPDIRKKEALESGKILGISNHFFLGERDVRFTKDADDVNCDYIFGVIFSKKEHFLFQSADRD